MFITINNIFSDLIRFYQHSIFSYPSNNQTQNNIYKIMIATQLQFFLDSNCCQQRTDLREYLLAIVSSQMLNESKYYQLASESRDTLTNVLRQVSEIDPEFILQVAYYVRHKLYLRSVTNFILAFATLNVNTKKFCEKYFCPTLLIPGDLIEVCQYVQVIRAHDKDLTLRKTKDIRKILNFPKILQKQIQKKLISFSIYQLGKQCSDSSRKKNLKTYKQKLKQLRDWRREIIQKRKGIQQEGNDDEQLAMQKNKSIAILKAKRMQKAHQKKINIDGDEKLDMFDTNFIFLKDLIKLSHASRPQFLVASVLGQKYPKTLKEFQKRFPDEPADEFQPQLAGQRMKLPAPFTWDRELSNGEQSKREIWQQLLLQNNVPYLALIRNLRNILQAGVSDEAHLKAIDKIRNPKQVRTSKIFPLQYFAALKEIAESDENDSILEDKPQNNIKMNEKHKQIEIENLQQEDAIYLKQELIDAYSEAIEEAIRISVDKNLETIPGVTYIFVDVSGSMKNQISGGKKYGSINTCMDCGFVLGHLIRMKCEGSQFYLFAAPNLQGKPFIKVEFNDMTLLQGIQHCKQEAANLSGVAEWIGQTVKEVLLRPKVQADNIVIISDMMITQGFSENGVKFDSIIRKYIDNVNKDAKFFFMDISGYGKQTTFGEDLKSKNCFLINGMSDNVLKYISEAGKISQVEDVVLFSKQLDKELKVN
ncbi:Telomerase protein component 1 [Paramecium bursaria]